MTALPNGQHQAGTRANPPSLHEIAAQAKPGVGEMFDRLLAHHTNQAFGWGFEAHRDLCRRAYDEYEAGLITADELRTYCTTGEV
jgi:hypothetical protein